MSQATPPSGSRRAAKVVAIVVAAILVIVVLFTVVFPRVERYFEDPTFDTGAGPASLGLHGGGRDVATASAAARPAR